MSDTTSREIAKINLEGYNALHVVSQHIERRIAPEQTDGLRMFDVDLYISSDINYPDRQRAIKEALDSNGVKYTTHPKSSISAFENDKYKNLSEVIKIRLPDSSSRKKQISDIRETLRRVGSTTTLPYKNVSRIAISEIGNEDTREAVVKAVNDQYRTAGYGINNSITKLQPTEPLVTQIKTLTKTNTIETKEVFSKPTLTGWNTLHVVTEPMADGGYHGDRASKFNVEIYITTIQENHRQQQERIMALLRERNLNSKIEKADKINGLKFEAEKTCPDVIRIPLPTDATRRGQIQSIRGVLDKLASHKRPPIYNESMLYLSDLVDDKNIETIVGAVNDQYRAAGYLKEMPDRSGRSDHTGIAKHEGGGKTAS